jgi:hypothetical protein
MIHSLLNNLSVYSVLAPLAVGLYSIRLLDQNSKAVLLLLAAAAIPQLASDFLPRNSIWPFYNSYAVVDGLFWAFIYFRNSKYLVVKRLIATFAIGVFATAIVMLFIEGIDKRFYNELVCLNSLLQVIWVLVFIFEHYIGDNKGMLEHEPIFWFSVGLLIYAPVTYFLFAFFQIINDKNNHALASLWSIHHLVNACMYFTFTIGMYVNRLRTAPIKV